MVLEKTLESLLDCKEIKSVNPKWNQLWKFIRRTDAEAELQYFGHHMWRTNSLEKTLMLGMTEGKRRREWQRMRWLDSITSLTDMNLSKLWGEVKNREAWCAAVHGVTRNRTWLGNWTTISYASSRLWHPQPHFCTWWSHICYSGSVWNSPFPESFSGILQ